jgi:DNA-binding XRE family transcriptional regulator
MTEYPCEEMIAPIYKLMTGLQGSPGVLNEIPHETMSNLQLELTKTLRNLDDHMGNLLCLATFARIANSDIQQHGPQPPSWLENIQHFFGPKRGLKTLDLVVLRVILACSASCSNLEAGKAAESVRLAIEICENVEPDRKNAWIEGNSSKIAKLREKVTREGIGQEVQMMVCLLDMGCWCR